MNEGSASASRLDPVTEGHNDGGRTSSLDGTSLWYRDHGGRCETIVFLHGFSGSSSAAGHFASRAAARGHRLIVTDLRGHGLSEKPHGSDAYALDRFVEDLRAVLDACNVERAHVVGHCMGGMVAVAGAAAAPERVSSLTLVATSLRPAADQQLAAWAEERSPDWMRALAMRAFPSASAAPAHVDYSAFDDTGDFYWRRMVADYRALSAETAFAIIGHLKGTDVVDTARRVAAPALVVHGDRDSIFPPACAERAAEALGGRADVRILPGHNHVSPVLQPDSPLFDEALGFIESA